MQNQYSLAYREEEREMNAYCKFAGIGLIPWGPLNAGTLARPLGAEDTARGNTMTRKADEWENEIIRRVEKVSKDKGWSMSQISLAWINEKVTSPIVGFSSVSSFHLVVRMICLTPCFRSSVWRRRSFQDISSPERRSSSWRNHTSLSLSAVTSDLVDWVSVTSIHTIDSKEEAEGTFAEYFIYERSAGKRT
jgi:hypothetical protein